VIPRSGPRMAHGICGQSWHSFLMARRRHGLLASAARPAFALQHGPAAPARRPRKCVSGRAECVAGLLTSDGPAVYLRWTWCVLRGPGAGDDGRL
jgi:hypothetical protein